MRNMLKNAALAATVTGLGVAAYNAGQADASGVPTTDPLYYGGVLEEDGQLIEGSRALTINIWLRVDSVDQADRLCSAEFPDIELSAGRFRVALPESCLNAVRTRTELWSEIEVDGTSVGRAKIAALPYAVSAEYAVDAVDAAAAQASELDFHVAGSVATQGALSAPNGTSSFEELTVSAGGEGDMDLRLATGVGGTFGMSPILQVFDDSLSVYSLTTGDLNPKILRPRSVTQLGSVSLPRFDSPAIMEPSGRLSSTNSTWGNVNISTGPSIPSFVEHSVSNGNAVCPNDGVLVGVRVDSSFRPTRIRCTK